MICAQPIPQLQFINTNATSICLKDSTQVFTHSNHHHSSSNLCGTPISEPPSAQSFDYTPQLTDSRSLSYPFPALDYDQMDSALQELWDYDDSESSCLDDQPNRTPSDQGLGISTNTHNYALTEVPFHDNIEGLSHAQTAYYMSYQIDGYPPASSIYQFSETPTGWNSAYNCGTPNVADSTVQTSSSQQSTPFLVHENAYLHQIPSPATQPYFVPSTVNRDESMFRRPMNRPNSAVLETPQASVHSWATPMVQSSPSPWTDQLTTPVWPDTMYSRHSLPLPQTILDYSQGYHAQHRDHTGQDQPPPPPIRAIMTVPPRRRSHLRPSLSESCVPRLSSPARIRAASTGHFLHPPQHNHGTNGAGVSQLPLPPLLPSMLIHASPVQMPVPSVPVTPSPPNRLARSYSNTPQHQSRPSSPPEIDFNPPNTFSTRPVRQEPTFTGDLYTPTWRRRNSDGRWEGWCGYCQPGRWLDLKNSRYWEDKLRTHGICAKTKKRFIDPIEIRWVTPDGTVIPTGGLDLQARHFDGGKRQGLCGTCHEWIVMDGPRTKALNRPTGWFTHAYKCHNHSDPILDARPQTV